MKLFLVCAAAIAVLSTPIPAQVQSYTLQPGEFVVFDTEGAMVWRNPQSQRGDVTIEFVGTLSEIPGYPGELRVDGLVIDVTFHGVDDGYVSGAGMSIHVTGDFCNVRVRSERAKCEITGRWCSVYFRRYSSGVYWDLGLVSHLRFDPESEWVEG